MDGLNHSSLNNSSEVSLKPKQCVHCCLWHMENKFRPRLTTQFFLKTFSDCMTSTSPPPPPLSFAPGSFPLWGGSSETDRQGGVWKMWSEFVFLLLCQPLLSSWVWHSIYLTVHLVLLRQGKSHRTSPASALPLCAGLSRPPQRTSRANPAPPAPSPALPASVALTASLPELLFPLCVFCGAQEAKAVCICGSDKCSKLISLASEGESEVMAAFKLDFLPEMMVDHCSLNSSPV